MAASEDGLAAPFGVSPISVSEAVGRAKGAVGALGTIVVSGEVSGCRGRNARSGHCYFQLKDEVSSMDVSVWSRVYDASGVEIHDGLRLQVMGKFDVYNASGKLSLSASKVALEGEGLLRQQVAALAKKLELEGLMDASRKPRVPQFCTRVCVVTSLSGSVLDDVKRTLARRNPLVALDVVGCAVQGKDAPATIIRALGVAAASAPDAILLVRGGGSFEDLMCFNDEALARAIAASPVPVVTGIGHEPDTSIADMVASRRCSTPTAAAESVAPAMDQLAQLTEQRAGRLLSLTNAIVSRQGTFVDGLAHRLGLSAEQRLARERARVDALASHACLTSPMALVEGRALDLERTAERLHMAGPRALARAEEAAEQVANRLHSAGPRALTRAKEATNLEASRLDAAGKRLLVPHIRATEALAAQLGALSPMAVLSRGYAIVRDDEGHVVVGSDQLESGARVSLTLGHGGAHAKVTDVWEDDER